MSFVTYGYHDAPALSDSVEIDGVTYDRIERLPRNLRPGDLLAIGDNTDRAEYHRVFVTIVDVSTYPEEIRGYRRYAPQCDITFRFPEHMYPLTWRWSSWGHKSVFRDSETKERVTWAYRARK